MEPAYFMDRNGLAVDVHEDIFTSPDEMFRRLEEDISYLPPEKSKVIVRGKTFQIPRQHQAYGDNGVSYTFSGLTLQCQPWTPLLLDIKSVVEQLSGIDFNFVLVNKYRDGSDCLSSHKENEEGLPRCYPICTVTFGEERNFLFKREGCDPVSISPKHGSAIVMRPPTNRLWMHSIPRDANCKGTRLTLTFRKLPENQKKRPSSSCEAPSAKRHRSSSEKKTSCIKLNSLPPYTFYLGDSCFVTVSVFRGKLKVHVRRYDYDEASDSFQPTPDGITFTPFAWTKFVDAGKWGRLNRRPDMFFHPPEVFIWFQSLDTVCLQQLSQKNNGTLIFSEKSVTLKRETFNNLIENYNVKVAETVRKVMCTMYLAECVKNEVSKLSSFPTYKCSDYDVLTTSLAEILKSHLDVCIAEVFECSGCKEGYENQLGHECMTLTRQEQMFCVFDFAFAKIDIVEVAKEFVSQNKSSTDLMTQDFFNGMNIDALLLLVKELYSADDEYRLKL